MAEATYNLAFKGYWRAVNKGGIPAESGIYCVYACTYNQSENTVSLRKLIYIGESDDVKARIADHEKWDDWESHLMAGETLCFSFAPIGDAGRVRAECAMINYHSPPENIECVNSFPYDTTRITTSGKNHLLKSSFTVYRR